MLKKEHTARNVIFLKSQRLSEWIKTHDPSTCCLQETCLPSKDTSRLKMKGWKKIFHAKSNQRRAGVAILISDKINFKSKKLQEAKKDIIN